MADIELVIKIDEELYNDMKSLPFTTFAEDIIINGTPLPKGHGRGIDSSKLSYNCMFSNSSECEHIRCETCQFNCVAKYDIEDAPTLIEADKAESEDKDADCD